MSILIGSAYLDDTGRAYLQAGKEQNGRGATKQEWYPHALLWQVFRAKDVAVRRLLAEGMQYACDNPRIRCDARMPGNLYELTEGYGFNCSRVITYTYTDCCDLIRVCCAYAGLDIVPRGATTLTLPAALMKSGAFMRLTSDRYTKQSAYLCAGDILCTKLHGQAAIVLTDGSKASNSVHETTYALGDRSLRPGYSGDDVRQLQMSLIRLGYNCGSLGADGEFGDPTELAVIAFNRDHGLDGGDVGPSTLAALAEALQMLNYKGTPTVEIVGGSCYVRALPKLNSARLGVVYQGTRLPYDGEVSNEGWIRVRFMDGIGWISGRYARLP